MTRKKFVLLWNVLWWKFAKFFMSFLKAQVSFPSNVASIFSAIKHNSPIPILAKTLYTFFKRSPLKVQIYEIFEYSGQNLSNSSGQFWTDKSVHFQILHHSLLSWHKTPQYILSSYIFNFRQKYAIKVPIWRLLSALVKTC